MITIITVFLKEVLDNIRDRRTLSSALIMGPIFGPVLFSVVINLSIERSLDDAQKTLELPVIGAEHAPNLVDYLVSKNIDAVDGPADLGAAMWRAASTRSRCRPSRSTRSTSPRRAGVRRYCSA